MVSPLSSMTPRFRTDGFDTTRCPLIVTEISEGKSFHCFDVRKMTASDFSVFNLSWFFPYQSVTSVKYCLIFVIVSMIGWLCFTAIYIFVCHQHYNGIAGHALSCSDEHSFSSHIGSVSSQHDLHGGQQCDVIRCRTLRSLPQLVRRREDLT